jgi:hypothetical protein
VISGVLVFVIGQVIVKLVLDPVAEQKRAIGVIAHRLIFYADVYSNPGTASGDLAQQASRALREASSQLQAATALIPRYLFLARIGLVLPREAIDTASSELIGLSNSTSPRHVDEIQELRKRIVEVLRLSKVS